MNLYTDNDPNVCAWLTVLVDQGHLPAGDVLCKSITDLQGSDLSAYTQVHLFCGIGGWPLALRLAGWPDDRPVWSGSCPCQPFSAAGKRRGVNDERHLWPVMRRLVAERRPATVFGEQVASADGREWLAGVRADLEALGYAVGAADLCAASVGAPHIRQRLFWVAHASAARRSGREDSGAGCGDAGAWARGEQSQRSVLCGGLGDADGWGRHQGNAAIEAGVAEANPWTDATTIACGDGKTRRIEPGLSPLVDGVPGRVGRLRGYGNAIVPQVAAEFVRAFVEAECSQ